MHHCLSRLVNLYYFKFGKSLIAKLSMGAKIGGHEKRDRP